MGKIARLRASYAQYIEYCFKLDFAKSDSIAYCLSLQHKLTSYQRGKGTNLVRSVRSVAYSESAKTINELILGGLSNDCCWVGPNDDDEPEEKKISV